MPLEKRQVPKGSAPPKAIDLFWRIVYVRGVSARGTGRGLVKDALGTVERGSAI